MGEQNLWGMLLNLMYAAGMIKDSILILSRGSFEFNKFK